MSTLNINLNNVQPLDTILTGLSGLAYSGNQGLFIKVNATADGFEFAAGSGGVWGSITGTLSAQTDLQNALNAKQATLVNQTNIKSINGNSLLGSGDLSITTDLSAYLTIASAASTYATIASLSSYLTTAAAASTYVPYTGASGNVDLGNHLLNAKSFHIKGTAGNGHLGLKHQSAGATAGGSESVIYADSVGDPKWKNDGNAVQNVMLENAAITGATKTKITYDAKGLVTAGADATTADIAASTNKNYVTDAQLTVIGNTSGTNSGNQTLANTSNATSHTVTLSATGGSVQLVEGSGITLTTTGTSADGIITIASSGGGGGSTFADNIFEIYDNTDNTKKLAFQASGITTGTTRTLTIPNASGTIALTSDLASYVPYTGATGAVNLGANNLTVDTNVFFVDATNNRVGLGTASPNNTLTVSNNGTSYSTAGFITQFYQGTTNTDVKIMMADASNFISITYGGTAVSNTQWAGFTMGSGNAAFRVWGSDNIGIGYTNGNLVTNKFQVSGNSRIDGLLRFFTDTSAAVALKRSGTALQIRLADDSGYAPLESASVSINTTVANYKLNIYDSTNGARMGFYNASTGTTTSDGMFVGLDDGLSGSWWNFEAGYIRYGTSNTERMRITSTGKIGVGTTSPNASALFQIDSTTLGFLPPRMTTTQKNNIATPTAGLIIYDTTLNKLCVYTTAWETITSL